MKELLEKINKLHLDFMADATKLVEKNNKMAGRRARTASLEMAKLMKEFRQTSLKKQDSEEKEEEA